MKKIEIDEQCPSCKGRGIYVGMAEHDGYGNVCYTCKGTGKYHFVHEFEEFTEKIKVNSVRRVVECNPGIILGGDLNFGGMTYEEWWNGKKFEIGMEMREYVCPHWWYQNANYDITPDWDECEWGAFSKCSYFQQKDKCWKRFDEELNNR